jgi:hypothetical protein
MALTVDGVPGLAEILMVLFEFGSLSSQYILRKQFCNSWYDFEMGPLCDSSFSTTDLQ